jgi:putative hemolysin
MNALALTPRNLMRTFREVRQSRSILARVRDYRNFISLNLETEEFVLRTVEHPSELIKVLNLRHDVFVKEWQGRKAFHRLDVDEYDFQADHLVIIEKKTQQIVGTYRLLCSRFTDDFYSATEFNFDAFRAVPGTKLELGRACVRSDYRNGPIIDLLWRGLGRYIQLSHSRYLFGCSSVKSTDPELISNLFAEFKFQEQWSGDFNIEPLDHYQFPNLELNSVRRLSAQERRGSIPTLLRTYFSAGAKVYGAPALDRDFGCADLFTILDISQLNAKFKARYF